MAPRKYVMDRRTAASQATRQRVVEAAVALHGERGTAATRWADIAERADVALGTVYRYFPSNDELIPACTSHAAQLNRPPTPDIFSGEQPGADRIAVLVRESFAFYERAATWLRHGMCDRRRVPALDRIYRRNEEAFEGLVRLALGPKAAAHAVDATVALTSFSSWNTLHGRGLSTGEAATLVTDLLTRWLGGGVRSRRRNSS
jgi:AcrR family transcriptional regulator